MIAQIIAYNVVLFNAERTRFWIFFFTWFDLLHFFGKKYRNGSTANAYFSGLDTLKRNHVLQL